ncbi:hypothetical protein NL676_002066 [Syzygium grande]|nr:hypothetical protein NL676_002066 [Syzygium grande]
MTLDQDLIAQTKMNGGCTFTILYLSELGHSSSMTVQLVAIGISANTTAMGRASIFEGLVAHRQAQI